MKTFRKKDLASKDGMLTYVWGPPLWHVLHIISFNYPLKPTQAQKKEYQQFFDGLKNVLPCRLCRENLVRNLVSTNYSASVFESRETLSRWVYALHENVNKMLGKHSGLSYDAVVQLYENFRARCGLSQAANSLPPKKEKGCTQPIVGIKSKCLLRIVPLQEESESLTIDPKCVSHRTRTRTRTRKKNRSH